MQTILSLGNALNHGTARGELTLLLWLLCFYVLIWKILILTYSLYHCISEFLLSARKLKERVVGMNYVHVVVYTEKGQKMEGDIHN